MIRVLVVDDSAVMRALIISALGKASDMEIVGEAADPIEARAAIKALNPDVVTLDVEMPNMNGLDFLEKIMRLRPTPVVMCSTLTHRGAEAAIRALEIGAVDCVGKPTGAIGDFDRLVEKVRCAATARLRPMGELPASPAAPADHFLPNGSVVAIGSSTGGVEALIQVLSQFPPNCPPTLITQHMPASFTKSFAARLDRLCAPTVEEAYDGAPVAPGRVYLAPGGESHLKIDGRGKFRCRLDAAPPVNGHRPSVDVLFESVAACAGKAAIGVILTGMGRDGAAGLLAMRQAGASTLGQDEASSVVYGMPRVAFEMGAVERQASLGRLSTHILALARQGEPGA
jgi:two-component system chemotaxis response regulator CheB